VNLSAHEIGFESLDGLSEMDSLCVFVAEDERPLRGVAGYLDWRLCGQLSRVLQGKFFTGEPGDCLLLPSDGRVAMPRVFVMGLGPGKRLSEAALHSALEEAARTLSKAKVEAVALEVPGAGKLDEQTRAEAVTNSFIPKFKGKSISLLSEKTLSRRISGVTKDGK